MITSQDLSGLADLTGLNDEQRETPVMPSPFISPETQRAGAPVIVIGLSEFGQQVLAALDRALRARPDVPRPLGVWAGAEGWNFRQAVMTALRQSKSPDGETETLDVYLVAHLHDPLAREVWPKILSAAREACPPFIDHVFTLIFATGSQAFLDLPADEALHMAESLDALESELLASAEKGEQPGRIGWCYLLDTVDTHGQPLPVVTTRMDSTSNSNSELSLQAHHTAEFIALQCAGLRRSAAYRRTSLADLVQEFNHEAVTARVSAFAAGSLALPIPALAKRACDSLVQRLLTKFLLGGEKPGDVPAAQQLRTRWLRDNALAPRELRRQIMRGPSGQPLAFPIEPPQVERVPDEWLVDHILNWDTILWGRWHSPDAPAAQMRRNAEAVIAEAGGWVEYELNRLMQSEIGGMRVAERFIAEAERALDEQRQQPDLPAHRWGHWLTELLRKMLPPLPDPTALPDLAASRKRLVAALRGRLNRRALWVRASLQGVTLLAFAWAAYLALRPWLGLGEVADALLMSIELLLVGVVAGLAPILVGTCQLAHSELRIHRAIERLIADVRRKYHALTERTLRTERAGVYAGLVTKFVEWKPKIEARRTTLAEAARLVGDDLRLTTETAPLLTESALPLPSDGIPEVDAQALQLAAEYFLAEPHRARWQTESADELLTHLRSLTEARLAQWKSTLNLGTWAAQNSKSLDDLAKDLHRRLRPAFPLTREERSGVPFAVDFIGWPASVPLSPIPNYRWETFLTGEPGRLAWVTTLHGLELNRLRALADLKLSAAVPETVEMNTQEVAPSC